ncbi:phosphoserine phosphatase [Frankia casuarinae]|uniref:HAD-IB family phosphatase n=1 Tax=Frankia TaxID=1854 RepID=UPI0003D034EA|nr:MULTISPECIES: HAD-IB family phosphatase [Frankia]ETA01350.1 phosphoserine phosphatase [Frankia sp. CcI6]EYT91077.1 phosphoserine phosphatase [Frankia casuarinae]KDA42516.1 phosphoserine phosphatase [Frankia sp. BMG5.23]OAA23093.1 HAD-superfamily subfamily IB hydrolase, TIGR01490 [Frankia casuarinae]ORT97079.1 haloacid dehalogenase [Frankia casuarinae]
MGLRERLAGRRVLVTGVTGFVGEALLERLLSDFPDTAVVALVRPRGSHSGAARLARMMRKPAFRGLREGLGAAGVAALLAERVEVIEGDLASMPDLPADLDVVIHCAGEVSFDPPVDEAFTTNVGGVAELLRALAAGGARPHLVHVSTAYVAGLRSGHIAEGPLAHDVDWRVEWDAASRVRQQTEDASRAPECSARFRAQASRRFAAAGAQTVSAEAERLRRAWVARRMVTAGGERAQVLGWTDAYTFTKALGERYLEDHHGDLPLTVVRPSIIESALRRPFPGWIEGFKMAEPLILAYGRGELPDFPASPDAVVDIIPVDLVVNAILAAAAVVPPADTPAYYTVCSGFRNPLLFRDLYAYVRDYFQADPLPRRGRGTFAVPEWPFAGAAAVEAKLRRSERLVGLAGRALEHAPPSDRVRRFAGELERAESRVGFLRRYSDVYRAYTKAELVYVDDATGALHAAMDPADQAEFGFDPACFDWRHYLQDVHCPAVTAVLRRPRDPAPPRRLSGHLAAGDGVLAVFDLDGAVASATVIESYLWMRLADASAPRRVRELASLAVALPRYVRAERRDRGHLMRSVYARYAGVDPAELERLVVEVAGDILLRRVKPAGIRRVREHRAAGHRTVLLTGAVEVLTRPFAPLFDDVVAARLEVGADGLLTGRLESSPLVGDARAAFIDHHARVLGADLGVSWAYADSQSDLPLLRAVGNPVAVNPDLALHQVARGAGWPIEEWASAAGEPRLVVGDRRERGLRAAAARAGAAALSSRPGPGTGPAGVVVSGGGR